MRQRWHKHPESGSALLVCLMLVLVMTISTLAGIRIATGQERMAVNVKLKNDSLQAAESALRYVELWLRQNPNNLPADNCQGSACALPALTFDIEHSGAPGADWQQLPVTAADNGTITWFRVVRLGHSAVPANHATSGTSVLYRLSVVSQHGSTRTVLESVYAFTQS